MNGPRKCNLLRDLMVLGLPTCMEMFGNGQQIIMTVIF